MLMNTAAGIIHPGKSDLNPQSPVSFASPGYSLIIGVSKEQVSLLAVLLRSILQLHSTLCQ
jgi:hypothetical protein